MTTMYQHPKARTGQILTETLESGEVVAYDRRSDHAHCLNTTAAAVWGLCNGERSVAEITAIVAEQFSASPEDAAAVVSLALDDLIAADLIHDAATWAPPGTGVDRRQLLARIGVGAAAAIAVPAIMSIVAPTPAAAATCLAPGTILQDGQSFLDCCSKLTRKETLDDGTELTICI